MSSATNSTGCGPATAGSSASHERFDSGRSLPTGDFVVERLRVAIPARVEERLADHRDRAHQRAGIAVAVRLERHHLGGVRAQHVGDSREPSPRPITALRPRTIPLRGDDLRSW